MAETESLERGIWTNQNLDLQLVIGPIYQNINQVVTEWTSYTPAEAQQSLSTLFSYMIQPIEKKFDKKQIEKHKVLMKDNKEYNFYQLKELTDLLTDKALLKMIFEANCNIFNFYMKQLRIEIATFRSNPPKKLLNALFSLIPNRNEEWHNNFIKNFKRWAKLANLKRNMFNFSYFAMGNMPDYDLNCNELTVGFARSSKSTGELQGVRRYYSTRDYLVGKDPRLKTVDQELITSKWNSKFLIYSQEQGSLPLKKNSGQFIVSDETYLTGDRRKSMQSSQIDYTADIATNADNNNVVGSLIQDITDIDSRIYHGANIIRLVYQRGKSLIFARARNFAVLKATNEFERFQKAAYLLSDFNIGLHHLRSLPSYIADGNYNDLVKIQNDEYNNPIFKDGKPVYSYINPFYDEYLRNKRKYKEIALEEAEKDIAIQSEREVKRELAEKALIG